MFAILQNHSRINIQDHPIALARGLSWGFLGGLVATLVMDIILIAILVAAGLPASTCFSIVGDTAASLFFPGAVGSPISIPLGIASHYLIGPFMGAVFGAGVAKAGIVRIGSRKKILILAVLYAEILSQPMLAAAAILLHMPAPERLQWFGGSMVMHILWGIVLGIVWSRGQRSYFPTYHQAEVEE